MTRSRWTVVPPLVFSLSLLTICAAQAGPLLPSRFMAVEAAFSGGSLNETMIDVDSLFRTASGSGPYGDQMQVDGFALSTFGLLRAQSTIWVNLAAPLNDVYTNGWVLTTAGFVDVLTIESRGRTGRGFLTVSYALDGAIVETGNVNSEAEVLTSTDSDGFGFGNGALPVSSTDIYQSSVSGTFTSGLVPFVYGQPFHFMLALHVAAGNTTFAGYDGQTGPLLFNLPNHTVSGFGFGDFADTLSVTGVTLFDRQQRPTDGAVAAASGFAYKVTSVPEPAAVALLFGGSAAALARRRKTA
jgi:hypothetical protein